jgi:hypothetical protein
MEPLKSSRFQVKLRDSTIINFPTIQTAYDFIQSVNENNFERLSWSQDSTSIGDSTSKKSFVKKDRFVYSKKSKSNYWGPFSEQKLRMLSNEYAKPGNHVFWIKSKIPDYQFFHLESLKYPSHALWEDIYSMDLIQEVMTPSEFESKYVKNESLN